MSAKHLPLIAAFIAGCGTTPPRTVESVAMEGAREGVPACTVQPKSIVADGTLGLAVGETVCLKFTTDGDKLKVDSIVSKNDEASVVIKTWIEGTDTYVRIHNSFPRQLRYMAMIRAKTAAKLEYTTTCTVLSKRFGLEHWPYEIAVLYLGKFELQGESDEVKCF